MFVDESLQNHLETSSSISGRSLVVGEWLFNLSENIAKVGNYRYRPSADITSSDAVYKLIANIYDENDANNQIQFYTDATDADVIIDDGFTNELDDQNLPVPAAFKSKKEKEKLLYSLEDCFGRFRPRSGINKLRYFADKFSHFDNPEMSNRPRYYMAHKDDKFKYWTSYRTENNIERGISKRVNNANYIDDAAPFVVYNKMIPSNKIVIKMQTNVGTADMGSFSNSYSVFDDPFYGYDKQTTPSRWKVQTLSENNVWTDAISFDSFSYRYDGSPVIGPDGYVELSYGVIVPPAYEDIFVHSGEFSTPEAVPRSADIGEAFLVKDSDSDKGTYSIWTGYGYEVFEPQYGWILSDEAQSRKSRNVVDLVSASTFTEQDVEKYREFSYIKGVRIVVDTMNVEDASFDLIEISPRLSVDLSDYTSGFSIKKTASDLGVSGMPVGQLIASTGSIDIFDFNDAFNPDNIRSILNDNVPKNLQIKFFDVISVEAGSDYFIPLKTMYADGFPATDKENKKVSINLRDLFFYFESITAPQVLIQNASVSYAVSLLLDSIGFSNYTFKRLDGESDQIIPYFFVPPEKSVAEVLQDIAVSTQTAMFFDEYNNFIMMSKNYMMPQVEDRSTDVMLYGSDDFGVQDIYRNKPTGDLTDPLQDESATNKRKLTNIISISSEQTNVFNDGVITYNNRHMQKTYGSLKQANLVDNDKNWIYRPALLWEVAPTETLRSRNDDVGTQSSYVLSAVPLNSDLLDTLPEVVNGQIVNNTIDFGEAVYWVSKYNGYFYANGEIVRYDAVEYSVSGVGNVWVRSNQEYQRYFSMLPFNGKMYPTGLVRIYAEPNYEIVDGITKIKNGPVAKHGRMQFGTGSVNADGTITPVRHNAGLDQYWSNTDPVTTPVRGCNMKSKYLFSKDVEFTVTGVTSDTTTVLNDTIVVTDASKIKKGFYVEFVSGNGRLSPNTIVAEDPDTENNTIVISPPAEIPFEDVDPITGDPVINKIKIVDKVSTTTGAAGIAQTIAQGASRNGIIKNFLTTSTLRETDVNNFYATQAGTIQSSAFVMNGPTFSVSDNPIDYVTYAYKPLNNSFKHFGTRMRIIGRIDTPDEKQTPVGSMIYYENTKVSPVKEINIAGGSGGLAFLIDPKTNNGYYLEIAALSEMNLSEYGEDVGTTHNIFLYKVVKEQGSDAAIPVKLWGGTSQFLVDDGKFTGQYRMTAEEKPTVYDISVEYTDAGNKRTFYIYLNNNLITVVDDLDPLPVYNNMALFVRGTSRVMFENLFAIANNYSQNTTTTLDTPMALAFGDSEVTVNEALRKYSMSGLIQSTYLSSLSPADPPKYNIYFEEFGTVMREAAYFNIKYDKAYPALYAKISPTFNSIKGYTISGFQAGAYGAEFMVFNNTDSALNLDETTGNYLRIQGVTFTQESQNQLTVDEFFSKNSDFSKIDQSSDVISSINKVKKNYEDIRNSRLTYGNNGFNLQAPYIQDYDSASEVMSWMISKIMKPRKAVGVRVFGMQTVQLGDIVEFKYTDKIGTHQVALDGTRFVIYSIDYQREVDGPSMTLYLSEVV